MHLLYANWMLYLKVTDLTGTGKYFVALKSSFEHVLNFIFYFFFFAPGASNTYRANMMQSSAQIKHPLRKIAGRK